MNFFRQCVAYTKPMKFITSPHISACFLGAASFLFLVSLPTVAEAKKGKKEAKLNLVTSVSKKTQSFIVGKKTYVMGERVSITVDGKKAGFEQIKEGMSVKVKGKVIIFGRGNEGNTLAASRIQALTVKKK